jgi:hypothetical protein
MNETTVLIFQLIGACAIVSAIFLWIGMVKLLVLKMKNEAYNEGYRHAKKGMPNKYEAIAEAKERKNKMSQYNKPNQYSRPNPEYTKPRWED